MKKFLSLLLIILIIIGLMGCKNNTPLTVHEADGFCFSTIVSVKLYGCGSEELAEEAVSLCRYYERIFSKTLENSLLYKMNQEGYAAADSEEHRILMDAVEKSLTYSKLTDGAMDITIEPVVSLWDFTDAEAGIPDTKDLEEAVNKVGYDRISVTDDRIALNGTQIDMGAVAKGYIADRIKEFLVEEGVTSGLISLGGNILCIGRKPDKTYFNIGVQKPFDTGEYMLAVSVEGKSVVTSGIYERYFEKDGIIYHHILKPDTGMPCDNELMSVTIISDSSLTGDCLSTGCFVMGLEAGLGLIDSIDGVYAIFIDKDYKVHYSDGAELFVKKG